MAEPTPMMQQYLSIKRQHPDQILFFRLGDFYEMFYDDAKLASRELELTLTGKDCGLDERAPMCGIPYHSCDGYIARLIAKGNNVAICEQAEDPALAKGLVRREIVRVVTPGTVIEGSMLDEARNNYLAGVCAQGKAAGLCFCDVSTGCVMAARIAGGQPEQGIINELARFAPSEVILCGDAPQMPELKKFLAEKLCCMVNVPETEPDAPDEELPGRFGAASLGQLGLDEKPETVRALAVLLAYLKETQITGLERLDTLTIYNEEQYMKLDLFTRRNLELTETMRSKEKRGSLLWVLDRARTAMGKRLLRSWVEQPLLSCAQISRRLNAVQELYDDMALRSALTDALDGVFDLERLMTRIACGTANGRELRSLAQTIEKLPAIRKRLEGVKSQQLREIYGRIDTLGDLLSLIDRAIVEEPPLSVKDGGMIRKGFNPEVDELHAAMTDGRGFLAGIEARERERSGIRTLKIGYNRVFGYYIEITNSNLTQVPEDYIRKQTLTTGERYITQELKELESRVLGAQERVVQLEYELFDEVRRAVAAEHTRVQATASSLAQLDTLCSFALTAVANRYCCPEVGLDGRIVIKNGRHPVVEAIQSGMPFVPNDTELDLDENRAAIITGPNMAGKSTYMRQVALITLMAQIGSFVPATSAHVGLVDSIFTRVGASDDLASGQSTFMVEMGEVASILAGATRQSLLIFDEIGRGTSTFDGMSIARAVVEHVCDKKRLGAKMLFATHYHELTELEDLLDGVRNYNIAVKKHGDDITFLRRIIRGGADDSYGIEVARLAGIPESIVARSKQILKQLEAGRPIEALRRNLRQAPAADQISMIDPVTAAVMEKLHSIDANALTPIEAMNILFELWHTANRSDT
ncbi:MAG: DNA mismatch repair protein MutS [Clostridia bacterium]|nr:DNA mismatch repair protein MutS [Clostridia bacterium]